MTLISTLFLALGLSASQLSKAIPVSGVTSSPEGIDGSTYDYIVIGGGFAGLTVAGRLSEDPAVSVLVVEAGADDRDNPAVFDIYEFTVAEGTALDWQYPAEDGRIINSGKTLGGCSSINGGWWTRGSMAQYDLWSTLLEESEADVGWNWDGMLHYMRKSENFMPPTADQLAKGAESIPVVHGSSGPVHAAFSHGMYDLSTGNPNCVSMLNPVSINYNDDDRRSSSAEAYLTPVEKKRTNWVTLTQHLVTKIVWVDTKLPLVATGIEFATYTNTTNGTTRFIAHSSSLLGLFVYTPAVLQLSGVGDADILGPLNITTLIDLKTVGRNLQEQSSLQAAPDLADGLAKTACPT
ncbi:glucose-methanol-choline oxidoreductase [Mycena olivaceomarginata]|nr:glucose-methanol-choline oxidoreductase [Mycena olivaceomarginata]